MADLESGLLSEARGRNDDGGDGDDLPLVLLSLRSSSLSEPLSSRGGGGDLLPLPRRAVSYESQNLRRQQIPPQQQPTDNSLQRNWRNLLPIHLIRRISFPRSATGPPSPSPSSSSTTAAAAAPPSSTIEIFYCPICLENQPTSLSIELSPCHCHFCHESLQRYYETLILEGHVSSFHCPSCSTDISSNQIQQIISPQIFSKYLRFVTMKEHAGYRECPSCHHPTIGSNEQITIICEQCHESFCYLHSNAHQGRTCQQYLLSQKGIESKNQKLIKRMSRRCPSCGCHTEKNGGCNHMTCRACGEVCLILLVSRPLCLLTSLSHSPSLSPCLCLSLSVSLSVSLSCPLSLSLSLSLLSRVGAGSVDGISPTSPIITTPSLAAQVDNSLMLPSGLSGLIALAFKPPLVSTTSLVSHTSSSCSSFSHACLPLLSSPSSSLSQLSSFSLLVFFATIAVRILIVLSPALFCTRLCSISSLSLALSSSSPFSISLRSFGYLSLHSFLSFSFLLNSSHKPYNTTEREGTKNKDLVVKVHEDISVLWI
jgi:hypothetical protein